MSHVRVLARQPRGQRIEAQRARPLSRPRLNEISPFWPAASFFAARASSSGLSSRERYRAPYPESRPCVSERSRRRQLRRAVTRMEAQLPFGYVERELVVMPTLSVRVSPRVRVIAVGNCLMGSRCLSDLGQPTFACATAYWPVARIWRARETRSSAPPGAPSGPREVMTSVPLSTLSK